MPSSRSLALFVVLAVALPVHAQPSVEAEVRARERAWLDAYERPNPDAMIDMLTDDFVITFPDGKQMKKPDVVAAARRPQPADRLPTFTTRNTVARVRDAVVILIGRVTWTYRDAKGKSVASEMAYTDTWVREAGKWRVLTSHLSR